MLFIPKPSRQYKYLRTDFYNGLQPGSWSNTGGTFAFNNQVGQVAQDSQYCLSIQQSSWSDYVSAVGITEVYCFFKFKCSALPGSANGFFNLQAAGPSTQFMLGLNSTGTVFCKHGGAAASSNTTGTMVANVIYNVWCYWKAAASNGVGWVAFSTDENMPNTTSANYVSTAVGTGNTAITLFDCENTTANGTTHYFGQCRMDDKLIGSFPT